MDIQSCNDVGSSWASSEDLTGRFYYDKPLWVVAVMSCCTGWWELPHTITRSTVNWVPHLRVQGMGCCSAASHTVVSELSFMEKKCVGITDNQEEASFSLASSMQHFSAGVRRFCTLVEWVSNLSYYSSWYPMWSQGQLSPETESNPPEISQGALKLGKRVIMLQD